MPPVDLRPRPQRTPHSPLWHLNATLARPIATVFGLLGIAPGQLSLQSITLTAVGLLRAAGGDWAHIVQGALIVYGGLLLDRADDLLAERATSLPAWGRFLTLLADRVVEAALLIALGWLSLGTTSGWRPLPSDTFLLVVAAALGMLFLARLASVYGDLLVLRVHLAQARRLPGPSAVPRGQQARPWLSRLVDRDVMVLVWVVGVALQQFQVTTFLLLGGQAVVFIEQFVLFRSRRADPEPHAADVLSRGP